MSKRTELFANTEEVRRRTMSKVRSSNTSIEVDLRTEFAAAGLPVATYSDKTLPGKPDFAWTDAKVAVFAQSCFWHGCHHHGRKPKSRLDYWLPKIQGNRDRDARNIRALRSSGWTVMLLWEHDLKSARKSVVIERLVRLLCNRPYGA